MDDSPPPAAPTPALAPMVAGPRRSARLWKTRWFGVLTTIFSVLLVVAVCVEIYRRATNYGQKVVESHPVEARIEIVNPPAYLDRQIINSLLDEAYAFAQKDEATYNRSRNVLDGGILRDFAALYVRT